MANTKSGWSSVLWVLAGALACSEAPGSEESETLDGETEAGETDEGESDVCDPSLPQPCAAGLLCCSDDPTAIDLAMIDQLVTPEYQGGAGQGTPVFSGGNNPLSRWGTCVDSSNPAGGSLDDVGAIGCPIPCNPTWEVDDVAQVCGPASQCCQTRAIEFIDCVFDSTIGNVGCWRPVTGNDITGLGGVDASQWKGSEHATHQDPSGVGCTMFVAGIPPAILEQFGVTAPDVQIECFRRLGVANQRGYCTPSGTACAIDPAALDACQLRNEDELRTDCAELVP